MQLRLVYYFFVKAVWRRGARTIITCIMIAFTVFISTTLTSATYNIQEVVRNILGTQYALNTIRVTSNNVDLPLNERLVQSIQGLSSVASTEPYRTVLVEAIVERRRIQLILIGVPNLSTEVQQLEMKWGRPFSRNDHAAIILTERTLRAMGIADLGSVIGKTMTLTIEREGSGDTSPRATQSARPSLSATTSTLAPTPTNRSASPSSGVLMTQTSTGVSSTAIVSNPSAVIEPPSQDRKSTYSVEVVGIASRSPEDKIYVPLTLGIEMASWQSRTRLEDFVEQHGYNGVQVIAQRIEDVPAIQHELASLELQSDSALSREGQVKAVADRIQFILSLVLGSVLLLTLLLMYWVMWSTVSMYKKQIGTLLLVGASYKDIRSILSRVALAVVIPGAILGLGIGWLATSKLNQFLQSQSNSTMTQQLTTPLWIPMLGLLIALMIGWLTTVWATLRIRRRTVVNLLWYELD